MTALIEENAGLFPVTYIIASKETNEKHATLTLQLFIDTQNNELTGLGQIQVNNGPKQSIASSVKGDWHPITQQSKRSILLVADGYCASKVLFNGASKEYKNVKLRILLGPDWLQGEGVLEYKTEAGWHTLGTVQAQLDNRTLMEKVDALHSLTCS
jgi:subtilase family serine protease